MTVFFLIYMAISLMLLSLLESLKLDFDTNGNAFDAENAELFDLMDRRPITFYAIFIISSPLLLVLGIFLGILTLMTKVR